MNDTSVTRPVCSLCGGSIHEPIMTWIGSQPFHSRCAGNRAPPPGPVQGPTPVIYVTADEVRRIVLEMTNGGSEEIAKVCEEIEICFTPSTPHDHVISLTARHFRGWASRLRKALAAR